MVRLKIYISLVAVVLLTACVPGNTKNAAQNRQASTNLSASSPTPAPSSATNDTDSTADIVGSIISEIENQTGEEEAGIAQ